MRRTKRALLPALLLSLVLGAALALRLSYPASPLGATAPAADTSQTTPDPAAHHAAAGSGVVIPEDQRGSGDSGHHPAGNGRSVLEQLAARPDDVALCVSATLEPFDSAWAQLRALGTDEAAERTRRCLMELVFTHVDPATSDKVRAQLPLFARCYRGALALPEPDKRRATTEVARCLTTPVPAE